MMMVLLYFGGGRYDGLIKEIGGQSTPAVGFATGIDRLIDVYNKYNNNKVKERNMRLYIATIGDKANEFATNIVYNLRNKGIFVEKDICSRSINSQFKYANKNLAEYVITIGDDEIKENRAKIKNMETGKEEEIELSFEKILEYLS